MAKIVKSPKFVAKSGQWVVTVMQKGKQEQVWFSSRDEALIFFNDEIADKEGQDD